MSGLQPHLTDDRGNSAGVTSSLGWGGIRTRNLSLKSALGKKQRILGCGWAKQQVRLGRRSRADISCLKLLDFIPEIHVHCLVIFIPSLKQSQEPTDVRSAAVPIQGN